jgi:hypothetical protein
LKSADVSRALREVGGGDGLKRGARKAISCAAAAGLLRRPGERTRRAYLQGGRALERLWLTAESLGLGLHPMTGFLYWLEPMATMHERFAHFDSSDAFTEAEKGELVKLRQDFLGHSRPSTRPKSCSFA